MSLKDIYPFGILVITPDSLERGQDYDFVFQHVGVMLWDADGNLGRWPRPLGGHPAVPLPGRGEIGLACTHMARLLELKEHAFRLHNAAAITETRNRQLNQIGMALMSERNLDSLLNLILEKAMALTGSDAGCLYLVEPKEGVEEKPADYWANRRIRFKLTRNRSVVIGFAEMVMPPSRSSIVGNTMLQGKPLEHPRRLRHPPRKRIPAQQRLRQVLRVPHPLHADFAHEGPPQPGDRGHPAHQQDAATRAPITSMEAADAQVVPYRQDDVNISLSLASQASVALLNAQYERDIKRLFEGFINASVTAIESRDPTTSGHSHRVAESQRAHGRCPEPAPAGKYPVRFTETQLRELRYAALLHDFGKIGVRENMLVKAKKLFPEELEHIRMRADFIRRTIQWESAEDACACCATPMPPI